MSARTRAINLLPPSDFELSFWGRFLKWAVTAGRYIIIVTEMVVILAFLSRFKLDQDLADLGATLEGQKNVLEAQEPVEKEFRQVQSRLEIVDDILGNQLNAVRAMDKLVEKIPPEIKLVSLTVKKNEIGFQANTLSEKSLGEMISRMTVEPTWKAVDITDFSADNATGIKVVVSVKL